MSFRTDVKERIDKLTASTAFQAVAGAGDLAVEKFREAQDKLAKVDLQAGLARVPDRVAQVSEKAQERLAEVPGRLAALRSDPKAAQAMVQERARQVPERAQDLAAQLAGLALQTYGELAARGRTVIERRRGAAQPGTTARMPEPTDVPAGAAPESADTMADAATKAVAEAGVDTRAATPTGETEVPEAKAEPVAPRTTKTAARKPRTSGSTAGKTTTRTAKKA